MTSLFNFTPVSPTGGIVYSQHIRNIENALYQMMGFILPDTTAVTGITTVSLGNGLNASGSIEDGLTLWATGAAGSGIIVNTPSGNVQGNTITFNNGSNMSISGSGSNVYFHSKTSINTPSGNISSQTPVIFANGTNMSISASGDTIYFHANGYTPSVYTVYTNTVQAFTAQQSITPQTLTSSAGSIAWNAASGNIAKHTATEDTTLADPTNLVEGAFYNFYWIQHASSAKTLAFGSKWKFGTGSSTVSTTLSSKHLISAYYDGTDLQSTLSVAY